MPKTYVHFYEDFRDLYYSGNCTILYENRKIKIKGKAKEVEERKTKRDQERFSFSNVNAYDLSYVFMDEINLLY